MHISGITEPTGMVHLSKFAEFHEENSQSVGAVKGNFGFGIFTIWNLDLGPLKIGFGSFRLFLCLPHWLTRFWANFWKKKQTKCFVYHWEMLKAFYTLNQKLQNLGQSWSNDWSRLVAIGQRRLLLNAAQVTNNLGQSVSQECRAVSIWFCP